ncbi:MAG: alpha/beta hydrolase family protein, partial [Bryobacteraceae bacterium]
LDSRIARVTVSGYFTSRQDVWQEPIDRNVWGLLKHFGDAELAAMIAPRPVTIEAAPGPEWRGPSESDPKRRGAAPGKIVSPPLEAVKAEVARARRLGAKIELKPSGTAQVRVQPLRPRERQKRQFEELVEFTQKLVRRSESVRAQYWSKADISSPAAWDRSIQLQRNYFWNEVIGRLPAPTVPVNPRTRKSYTSANWDGYEVMLDIHPDVFAYGVLLVPRGIKPGEKRPVVVCQHGLNGRPQDLFAQPENEQSGYRYYRNIGDKLASLGFIVYLPQNPYTGDFRQHQRLANPLQLSLFSFIVAQNERALDWLSSLPYVDPQRIAFYGLSYGGKTALRIPSLLGRYALSICSGDFNEWIVKLTTVDAPYTYMFTQEYEMNEFDLAHVANHAEMALMIAPRPFMVERGHRDGVGVDEWVAYEYAKVRRFYDEMGIGDRTAIEFFNGPHRINGAGTVEFLRKHLRW